VGGKPADTVVDGLARHMVLRGPRTGLDEASTTFGLLSAPIDESATDAVTGGPADPDGIDEIGDIHGTALLAGDRAFDGNSPYGDGSRDSVMILNGTQPPGSALADGALASEVFAGPDRQGAVAWDASDFVTEIYACHYNQLVRLALLLVHDVQTAEEVVQDAFEAMHTAWRRLRDTEKALSYLRQTVVNRSRSVLRHRKVVDLHPPKPTPDEPSAEHAVLALLERSAVVSALHLLPIRQREAIVLRYYADLSEADIAKAMGISRGAVKSHTARAMAALKSTLEQETP
jgi:RNA polymerase sigma-70 factor (sigma-E family)